MGITSVAHKELMINFAGYINIVMSSVVCGDSGALSAIPNVACCSPHKESRHLKQSQAEKAIFYKVEKKNALLP